MSIQKHIQEHARLGAPLHSTSLFVEDYGAVGDGTTDDTAAIQSAIDAAYAAGGGVVSLRAKTYYIAGTLVPKNGVILRGSRFSVENNSSFRSVALGTILRGAGTNIGIGFNTTDNTGTAPTTAQMLAAKLDGAGAEDIAFTNFTYGIKIGSLKNVGSFNSYWKNLYSYKCINWGFYFENCAYDVYENITTVNVIGSATPGGSLNCGSNFFGTSLPGATWNCGNSTWLKIFANPSGGGTLTRLIRNNVFMARNGSYFNDLQISHVQGNTASSNIVSQIGTTVNGTPNITLPAGQGDNYPVDCPVTPNASAQGFFRWNTYFVVSQVGDVIQLANYQGGTAINATGTGNLTLDNYGFPAIEILGYGANGAAYIQAANVSSMDAEGNATAMICLQNAYMTGQISYVTSGPAQGVSFASHIFAKNVYGNLHCNNLGLCVELDAYTSSLWFSGLSIPSTEVTPIISYPPMGLYRDLRIGTYADILNLSSSGATGGKTFQNQTASGDFFTYPNVSLGQKAVNFSTTSLALTAIHAGAICYTGGSITTWTLPALVSGAGGGALNRTAGLIYMVSNASQSAVTLTLAANGADTFNYRASAKTSYAMTQGQSIAVIAQYDGTGAYWQVIGLNGAT